MEEQPEEAYKRGLNYVPLEVPDNSTITVQTPIGQEAGECELLFRQQPMPPIDDLDRKTRYCHGIAVRFIGYTLDDVGASPETALRIYGELLEAAAEHMEHYRAGERGPWTVESLVDALVRIAPGIYLGSNIRSAVQGYVARALSMVPQSEPVQEKYVYYTDASIKDACDELLGNVPTYHIASDVYDQCERSSWVAIRTNGRLNPHPAFVIAVDGETWLPVTGTPVRAQTEWLIVDARQGRRMTLYERAKLRGPGVKPGATQVCGAFCDIPTGQYHPIESSNMFVADDGGVKPVAWSDAEAGRLVRVAITFMLLLQNERVRVAAGSAAGHLMVTLPKRDSVDAVVDEVIARSDEQPA